MTSNNFLTTMFAMDIGDRIHSKRIKLGLSQEAVAEFVGVTREAVSQWEKGKTVPRGKRLEKLAEILNTTPTDLVFGLATRHLSADAVKLLEDWGSLPTGLRHDFAARIHDLALSIQRNLPGDLSYDTIPPRKKNPH